MTKGTCINNEYLVSRIKYWNSALIYADDVALNLHSFGKFLFLTAMDKILSKSWKKQPQLTGRYDYMAYVINWPS